MSEVTVKCPSCGETVHPIFYSETDEDGIRDLLWGADPETVAWCLEGAECPICGESLIEVVGKIEIGVKNEEDTRVH